MGEAGFQGHRSVLDPSSCLSRGTLACWGAGTIKLDGLHWMVMLAVAASWFRHVARLSAAAVLGHLSSICVSGALSTVPPAAG